MDIVSEVFAKIQAIVTIVIDFIKNLFPAKEEEDGAEA